MYRFFSFCLLSIVISTATAQIPPGYYNSASGSGYTLKSNLHHIIDDHTWITYGAVWDVYDESDIDPVDGFIWDIYSEIPNADGAVTDNNDPYNYTYSTNQCGNFSGENSCYNREHSFPKSWWGGSRESNSNPAYSDVHHLYPTDGFVNGQRSNLPYGEVGSASFTSQNGSKKGSARSGLGYSGTVFEPIDEYKGDLARTYFYMATRYEDILSSWSSVMLDGSTTQVYHDWVIDMLLEWHNNDPVDQKEITRNDAIYAVQGNRNPFIDHPEYASSIWGDCVRPTVAPSSIVTASVADTQFDLSFTAGDGDLRLVLVKEASAVDFNPVDATDYATGASTIFTSAATVGTGNKVISAGGTSSLTITGLEPETTYYIEVFEYCSVGDLYLTTSSLTGNVTTVAALPAQTYNYAYLRFNEIVMSTPGTDYELVELVGIPGQDLSDLSIISVDQNGTILTVDNLSGQSIPAGGYWIGANAEAAASVTEDYTLSDEFVNNTTTYFLVENFSGSVNTDLDTDDNGTLNSSPWDSIIDELGILESVGEQLYTSSTIGPDGTFLPPGAYRNSDNCGTWTLHTFASPPADVSPGTSNGTACVTSFNGASWTAGSPTATMDAVIVGNISGPVAAENLMVVEGVVVILNSGQFMNVDADLVNDGTITVASGGALEVGQDFENNGQVTIQSGGTLINMESTLGTGTVTMIRNTTFDASTGKYSFVSSPIANAQIAELGAVVYQYDETVPYETSGAAGGARYVSPGAPTTLMATGKGYASAYTGTVAFAGAPNTGDLSVSISKTDHSIASGDATEDPFEGFNLVGNPYPSAIDLNDFLTANSSDIEGSIWLWDDDNAAGTKGDNSDFITINSMGSVSGGTRSSDWNGYIGAMQGFFVQVKQSSSAGVHSVDFNNSMRSSANNADGNFFRSQDEKSTLKLSLTSIDGTLYDETLIGFANDAAVKKTAKYDAVKLQSGTTGFYSFKDDTKLAIQGLPVGLNAVVRLGANLLGESNEYQIAIEEVSNIDELIFLKDHDTGKVWDLRAGPYSFKSSREVNHDRFGLFITEEISGLDEELSSVSWTITEGNISVSGLSSQQARITIVDLAGKVIDEGVMNKVGNQYTFQTNLRKSNVYLFKIKNGQESFYIKAILK